MTRTVASRAGLIVVAGLLVGLPLLLPRPYWIHLAIMSLIYALAAQGLGLVLGFAGQLSLGHVGFFGIGAYASMILRLRFGWPYLATVPVALGLTAISAALVGYPALRLRGPYFAAATLGFAEIMRLVALNWISLTNGQLGLFLPTELRSVPQRLRIGSLDLDPLARDYYATLTLLAVGAFCVTRLIASRTGRAIVAMRENERTAESLGIKPVRYKLIAFVVGAVLIGLAGSYFGEYVGLVDPRLFSAHETILLLMMVVIGGARTIPGPIAGAFLLTLVPELLRINESVRPILYGLFIILTINLMPEGLFGALRRNVWRWAAHDDEDAGVVRSEAL